MKVLKYADGIFTACQGVALVLSINICPVVAPGRLAGGTCAKEAVIRYCCRKLQSAHAW